MRKQVYDALVLLVVVAMGAGGALWFAHGDGDRAAVHSHAHETPAQLTLTAGQKWATDASLRTGMQKIRELIAPVVAVPAGNALDPQQARQLSDGVQAQVSFLISHCKLDPKADAVLHVLIADLLKGAELLKKPDTGSEGMNLVLRVLDQYPQYFDHAGWVGLAR